MILLWFVFATICFSYNTILVESKHENIASQRVSFGDTFNVSWSVNVTKKTIKFTIQTIVDYKTGWILVGFMPRQKHDKPRRLIDTRGDVFVLWSAFKHGKHQWQIANCNTMQHKGNVTRDSMHTMKHCKPLYHLVKPVVFTKQTPTTVTAIVWRNLETKCKMDLPIDIKKHEPVYFFGTYGMQNSNMNSKWRDFVSDIGLDNFGDGFVSIPVNDMFTSEQLPNRKTNSINFAAKVAKQHWIGILIGAASCLTVVITCTVYCCTKRRNGPDDYRKKKVTVSFYKEDDYDDEAKVSFLQSTEDA